MTQERRKYWERIMEKNPDFADCIRKLLDDIVITPD